jgi:hypothetical protein
MLKLLSTFLFCAILLANKAVAQDTLPNISVKDIGGKMIVSWKNTYGARITNINIQRSADSIKNFTSIGTVLDADNRENGFVDYKSPGGKIFYRVFVAFAGGRYIFSKSHQPVKDTSTGIESLPPATEVQGAEDAVKPTAPKGFVASRFVYTGKDNNVVISLADAVLKKYSIKFLDENGNPVFEIKKITEPYLIIEKVNFLRSGWFHFELYENGSLLEKHKFFVPKDGKHTGTFSEKGKNK